MSTRPASTALRVVGAERTVGAVAVLRGVDLEVAPGEIVALLGPSGCGKTTLLRAVVGLDRLEAGEVWLGDQQLSGPEVHIESERRGIGMVFQDGVLFPHLDVARNVGFGLPKAQRRRSTRIDEALEMVGLSHLAGRFPDELSGGEAQRVALARALAPRPAALLFDEPFSNLDAPLRARLRSEVAAIVRSAGVTTLFVTHDRDEAFELGDRLALMRDGRIVQVDQPERAYREPVDAWAATMLGDVDLLVGDVEATDGGPMVRCALGRALVHLNLGTGPVQVVVRPEDITVVLDAEQRGGTGAVAARVIAEAFIGSTRLTTVQLHTGELLRCCRLSGEAPLSTGSEVDVVWSATRATVVPRR